MRSILLVLFAKAWVADGRRVNSHGRSRDDSQGNTDLDPPDEREQALSTLSLLILAHPEAGWQVLTRYPRRRPRSEYVRAQLSDDMPDEEDFLDSLIGDATAPSPAPASQGSVGTAANQDASTEDGSAADEKKETFNVTAFLDSFNMTSDGSDDPDWGGGGGTTNWDAEPSNIGSKKNFGGFKRRNRRRREEGPPAGPYDHIPEGERECLFVHQKELQMRTGYELELRELPLGGYETELANLMEHSEKNNLILNLARDRLSERSNETHGGPVNLVQDILYDWDPDSFEWERCASVMHNRRIVIQDHGAFIHAFKDGVPELRDNRTKPMTTREFMDADFPVDPRMAKGSGVPWTDQLADILKERNNPSEADPEVLPWSDAALETRGLGWMLLPKITEEEKAGFIPPKVALQQLSGRSSSADS